MVKKPKQVIMTGKRKKAIARARFVEGTGLVKINGMSLDVWGSEMARLKIREPLIIGEKAAKKFNIHVIVNGGGRLSQADAIRQSIARGLAKSDSSLKSVYNDYDRNLLVYDPRRTEPHHGHGASSRGSRRHKQRSKR
jgi:small subunit ribosomal protein S9